MAEVHRRRIPVWLEIVLLLALLAAAVWGLRAGYTRYMRSAYPVEYEEYVEAYAAEYGLPPSLLYAVIRTESDFNPEAVSSAGAVGLMQLTEDTFSWAQYRCGVEEELPQEQRFAPETSIHYGSCVLALLEEMYGVRETALAAYNAGMGNVNRWLTDEAYSDDGRTLKEIPYPETRHYVEKVLKAQEIYQRLYGIE